MNAILRYCIDHPRRVLVVLLLLVAAAAPGLLRLKLRTDGNALLPTDDPAIILEEHIRRDFEIDDQIVVVIRSQHPDGIFNTSTLHHVQALTTQFGRLEGLEAEEIMSLATERGDRVEPGSLRFRRFLEPLPTTHETLMRLRDDLRAFRIHSGTLVSYDEQSTCIFVGVRRGIDRPALYARMQESVDKLGPMQDEVHIVGAPVAESLLGTHILEDLGVPSALLGRRAASDSSRGPGPRRTWYELRRWVGRHIGLVPISIVLMGCVFFVIFRSLGAAALPLAEVGAALIFIFGLMGWTQTPIYLTIAVLPVILTAIALTDEIHVFTEYRRHLAAHPGRPHREALIETVEELWMAVVKASVTTAIGFLSFAISPIHAVQAFGFFMAIGIMFCMVLSLTGIPAALALVPPSWVGARPDGGGGVFGDRIFASIARLVVRRRGICLLVVLAVAAAAPLGLRRVVIQDSWIDGFAPESEFRRATDLVNEQFRGTHILLVRVELPGEKRNGRMRMSDLDHRSAKLPGDLVDDPSRLVGQWFMTKTDAELEGEKDPSKDPRLRIHRRASIESAARVGEQIIITIGPREASLRPLPMGPTGGPTEINYEISPKPLVAPGTLKKVHALEDFIEAHKAETVGGVIGPVTYLLTTNFIASARNPESQRLDGLTPARVLWLWQQYEHIRGKRRMNELIRDDFSQGLITVFLKNANFVDVGRLMADVRAYERDHLAPDGIRLDFSGDTAASQTLIGAIVQTQVSSVLLSLLGDLAVTALLGRSLGWGIYCILPCSFAVLLNFAVMGWTGMPLGVATSMFSAMTLGVGVDFAIHLTERFRIGARRGMSPKEAAEYAVRSMGPPVFIDTLAISIGFGVLIFSQVPPNARLGGLVILAVAVCLATTIVLLPGLLVLWCPKALRKLERGAESAPV